MVYPEGGKDLGLSQSTRSLIIAHRYEIEEDMRATGPEPKLTGRTGAGSSGRYQFRPSGCNAPKSRKYKRKWAEDCKDAAISVTINLLPYGWVLVG